MKSLLLAVAFLSALPAAAAESAPAKPDTAASHSLSQLGWLAGSWRGVLGEGVMEEQWMSPTGGTMLGASRVVEGGKTVFTEFIELVERPDGIFYVVHIGNETTEFKLTALDRRKAVFENPAHDFPQRILYAREGTVLKARIEGVRDGKPAGQVFVVRVVPCAAR